MPNLMLQEGSDLDAVMPVLGNGRWVRIIALTPNKNPIVHAIASLCGSLPALIDAATIAEPAFREAVARLIGMIEGRTALRSLMLITPAGWGQTHVDELVNAVQKEQCAPEVAAALIGPCNESSALLRHTQQIARTIRRWGVSSPDDPTAWMQAITFKERNRLIESVQRDPSAVALCMPWLPSDCLNQIRFGEHTIGIAIHAFAKASSIVQSRHDSLLQHLVNHACPTHLWELTRLACISQNKEHWDRVQTLIRTSPDYARYVVIAAPWNDLPEKVQSTILQRAGRSPVGAAVAAARGSKRHMATTKTAAHTTAHSAVFFAAINPKVWDALDVDEQRRWLQSLHGVTAPLAVRSLGLRPEVLERAVIEHGLMEKMLSYAPLDVPDGYMRHARAEIGNVLTQEAKRHARDAALLRAALLPVALREISPAKAHNVIASLPLPHDHGSFFFIASGSGDRTKIAHARAILRTPADLALAVLLQRIQSIDYDSPEAWARLRQELKGRTWDDVRFIMPILNNDVRTILMPNSNDFVDRLAHPDHRTTLRQALSRLQTFPLEIAIPTYVVLNQWKPWQAWDATKTVADALSAHGDVFMALVDAIADVNLRTALLPLPEKAALADALRALARDDPPTAHSLAYALRHSDHRTALHALLTAAPQRANNIWRALDDTPRTVIVSLVGGMAQDADVLSTHDPVAALALTAIRSGDNELQAVGREALAAHTTFIRAIWPMLSQETQQFLDTHPAFADLPITAHDAARSSRVRS